MTGRTERPPIRDIGCGKGKNARKINDRSEGKKVWLGQISFSDKRVPQDLWGTRNGASGGETVHLPTLQKKGWVTGDRVYKMRGGSRVCD